LDNRGVPPRQVYEYRVERDLCCVDATVATIIQHTPMIDEFSPVAPAEMCWESGELEDDLAQRGKA
jgi:hypothetical protein